MTNIWSQLWYGVWDSNPILNSGDDESTLIYVDWLLMHMTSREAKYMRAKIGLEICFCSLGPPLLRGMSCNLFMYTQLRPLLLRIVIIISCSYVWLNSCRRKGVDEYSYPTFLYGCNDLLILISSIKFNTGSANSCLITTVIEILSGKL